MRLVSLGAKHHEANFAEALRRGTAPDGSLYFPADIPKLSKAELTALHATDMAGTAGIILPRWLGDEIPAADLERIIQAAATFATPLRKVGDKLVLELFHGPTLAFKDVAARFLAALMGYFNAKDGHESLVVVATSGDTGGAIAHGFADVAGVKVAVLFPKGRVSALQYEQLTRTAANVIGIEVAGSFDDCQALAKQALADQKLADLHISSANSISIGRLLPQILYYANAVGQLDNTDHVRFVVPSGNMGNISAGLLGWQMGLPIEHFLAANNGNDSLARYVKSGAYEPRESIRTMSNAMDVGAPNNFPRFAKIFDEDIDEVRAMVSAAVVDDEQTAATIKAVYKDYGYLLDPHSAVAWAASQTEPFNGADIIVSTAAPEKFSQEIKLATGIDVPNAQALKELKHRPQRVTTIKNSYSALSKVLQEL